MLFAAIASLVTSVLCLLGGAIGLEKRSKAYEVNHPIDTVVAKTYRPLPSAGLNLPLSVLLLGFVLLVVGLVLLFV